MNEKQKLADREKGILPASGGKERTILVVEDDRTHRSLMLKILKECDFSAIPAENGYAALAKLETGQRFDLIIMDWDMPELDGLETVREIRRRQTKNKTPHVPVIAFTANRRPGDRERCLAAGMDAYLPKDVWMPRWRQTLIDNLQGLISGTFSADDFGGAPANAPGEEENTASGLDSFDAQALEQSAALLKDDLLIAVEEYLEDAAAYIRDIREGLEDGNAEKVARGSHPLKSNSKGFGLMAVSRIAESINALAEKAKRKEGTLESAGFMLPSLQEAFYKAEKHLRDMLRKRGF